MENSTEMENIMEEYKILKEKKDKMTKYKRDYQNIYYQQNTDKVKAHQKRYHDKVKNERNINKHSRKSKIGCYRLFTANVGVF